MHDICLYNILMFVCSDLSEYVLYNARREGGAFNEHCVVGAAFRGRSRKYADVIGYFNNQGYHTPATALMLVDNALYKLLAGPNASIRTGNYPMPRNVSEMAQSQLTEYVSAFGICPMKSFSCFTEFHLIFSQIHCFSGFHLNGLSTF